MKHNHLSDIQKSILTLYADFQTICKENNLHYCAIGGTAIGAVRHNGFIPWDDDMDLGMPVEDFERFKKICSEHKLPKHLEFMDIAWMGGKLFDNRTTVIETQFITKPTKYYGVFIDIFPMIGMPDNADGNDTFSKTLKDFSIMAQLYTCYPEVCDLNTKELARQKNELMHKYEFKTAKKVAGFCYFLYDGEGFRHPLEIKFENTTMFVSSEYDKDLTWHFGNYMELPPIEERRTHMPNMIVDLKTPCTQYQSDFQNIPLWIKDLLEKKHTVEAKCFKYSRELEKTVELKDSEITRLNKIITELLQTKEYRIGKRVISPLKKIKRALYKH